MNEIIHMKNLFEMKRKGKIEEKFRQYIKVCLKADNQNVKDMAWQAARYWVVIEELWNKEAETDDPVKWKGYMKMINDYVGRWQLLLNRLGLTLPPPAYIPKAERVKSAKEMAEIGKKLETFGKKMKKEVEKGKTNGE